MMTDQPLPEFPHASAAPLGVHLPLDPALLVGAGFWRRVAAYLIDALLITIATGVIWVALRVALGSSAAALMQLFSAILTVVYFACMESSEGQATIGKRVLGMRVVDLNGERISGWRALARYVSAGMNWLLLGFGYLVVAFHPQKRGLHDLIAQTRVVLEDPNDTRTPVLAWVVIGLWGVVLLAGLAFALFLIMAFAGHH